MSTLILSVSFTTSNTQKLNSNNSLPFCWYPIWSCAAETPGIFASLPLNNFIPEECDPKIKIFFGMSGNGVYTFHMSIALKIISNRCRFEADSQGRLVATPRKIHWTGTFPISTIFPVRRVAAGQIWPPEATLIWPLGEVFESISCTRTLQVAGKMGVYPMEN